MYTSSSKFACTNVFTALSCNVLKLNLATKASRTWSKVVASVVAYIGKLCLRCWLPQTTNIALHFCSLLCLSDLYLNIYWHFSTCSVVFALLTTSQNLNCCLCWWMWSSMLAQNYHGSNTTYFIGRIINHLLLALLAFLLVSIYIFSPDFFFFFCLIVFVFKLPI